MISNKGKAKAAARPAPLAIQTTTREPTSPTSASSNEGTFDYFRRPTFPGHSRNGSTSSSKTAPMPTKSASFPSPGAKSPKINVHTHCGRHSNEWLFSGWWGKKA